ncbi:unnamed protein product, partial [Amoebophrya sp. A120]|eukprot:GSA120T00000965001.1
MRGTGDPITVTRVLFTAGTAAALDSCSAAGGSRGKRAAAGSSSGNKKNNSLCSGSSGSCNSIAAGTTEGTPGRGTTSGNANSKAGTVNGTNTNSTKGSSTSSTSSNSTNNKHPASTAKNPLPIENTKTVQQQIREAISSKQNSRKSKAAKKAATERKNNKESNLRNKSTKGKNGGGGTATTSTLSSGNKSKSRGGKQGTHNRSASVSTSSSSEERTTDSSDEDHSYSDGSEEAWLYEHDEMFFQDTCATIRARMRQVYAPSSPESQNFLETIVSGEGEGDLQVLWSTSTRPGEEKVVERKRPPFGSGRSPRQKQKDRERTKLELEQISCRSSSGPSAIDVLRAEDKSDANSTTSCSRNEDFPLLAVLNRRDECDKTSKNAVASSESCSKTSSHDFIASTLRRHAEEAQDSEMLRKKLFGGTSEAEQQIVAQEGVVSSTTFGTTSGTAADSKKPGTSTTSCA